MLLLCFSHDIFIVIVTMTTMISMGSMLGAEAADGCFTSTFDLLVAQVTDTKSDDERKEYYICDNTEIIIGVPTDASFTSFVNGDWPLAAFRPNVSLLCNNNCTLKDGFIQAIAPQNFAFPTPDGGSISFNEPVDNLVISGFTFTGTLVTSFNTGGEVLDILRSGKNILIKDCTYKNIEAKLFALFSESPVLCANPGTCVPKNSLDITMNGITIENATLFNVSEALITGSSFSPFGCRSQNCKYTRMTFKNFDAALTFGCDDGATCLYYDICFSDTRQFFSIINQRLGSQVNTFNIYKGENVIISNEGSPFIGTGQSPSLACTGGLKYIANTTIFECRYNIFDADSCFSDDFSSTSGDPKSSKKSKSSSKYLKNDSKGKDKGGGKGKPKSLKTNVKGKSKQSDPNVMRRFYELLKIPTVDLKSP